MKKRLTSWPEIPKSQSLIAPFLSIRMFDGLTSLNMEKYAQIAKNAAYLSNKINRLEV